MAPLDRASATCQNRLIVMSNNSTATGVVLVIISSVSFGAMALFARFAYADGVTPISLLFIRFTLAAVIMIGIARMRGEAMPRGRTLLGFALMGGVGYVGQSLSFFTALTMANAGLVALLLYNIMFILPLIGVFLLAYFGTTSQQLIDWMMRHTAGVKLGTTVLFLLLAGWLGYSVVTS